MDRIVWPAGLPSTVGNTLKEVKVTVGFNLYVIHQWCSVLDTYVHFCQNSLLNHVTKTAFFHLRNIAKLRNMLSVSDAERLVNAFMTSRLDYCNALLGGCPASSINKLQIVQNAAARVLTRSMKIWSYYSNFTSLCTGYLLSSISVTK